MTAGFIERDEFRERGQYNPCQTHLLSHSIFVTTLFQQMAVKPQGKASTLSIYSFNLAALTLLPHTGFPWRGA